MAEQKRVRFSKEWKVGLVSAIIVALFIWVGFFLAGRNVFSKETGYYTVIGDASGINVSGPVLINGKKVGRIDEIDFVSPTDSRIKVKICLLKKYRIPQGTVASIESLGLVAGSGVVLRLGTGQDFIPAGTEIPSRVEPGLLEQLSPYQERLGSILSSLDSVLGRLNQVMDDSQVKDIETTLASFHSSMRNIESITAQANRLLEDNSGHVGTVMQNLQDISSMLVDNKDELQRVITNFSAISDTLAQAQIAQTMESLRQTVGQTEELFTRINRGEGSVGQLLNNDTLYRNLEASSRQLELLLQDLRINPERYVHISVFGRKEKKKDKPVR